MSFLIIPSSASALRAGLLLSLAIILIPLFPEFLRLEFQTALSRAFGEVLHTAGVQITASVENNVFPRLWPELSCDQRAYHLRLFVLRLAFERAFQLLVERGRRGDGVAYRIVDDLRIDVRKAPVNAQPGGRRSSRNLAANSSMSLFLS